jgi:hypothetical protein
MSVIERHLAGAHVSVPLKTPRSRQVGIPEAGYHPQFPIISFRRSWPESMRSVSKVFYDYYRITRED